LTIFQKEKGELFKYHKLSQSIKNVIIEMMNFLLQILLNLWIRFQQNYFIIFICFFIWTLILLRLCIWELWRN